jgi:hypothetical protein
MAGTMTRIASAIAAGAEADSIVAVGAGNGLRGDRNAAAIAASRPSPGNLPVRKTAWWAREDSNLQPDRYERRGFAGKADEI